MYVPKARKLPSGSWFCRVRVNGKDISITRRTKREAEAAAVAVKAGVVETDASSYTLEEAMAAYIESRESKRSPSTIRGYQAIAKNRFKPLHKYKLSSISKAQWQKAVDQEALQISPKTLKNSWFFICSVRKFCELKPISIDLPDTVDVEESEKPFLTAEELPRFIAALKGDRYEIPLLLALSGLRKSEILNVTWNDIDTVKGCITVHGAAVDGPDGKLVHKTANKNKQSRRTVQFMLPQLREAVDAVKENVDDVNEYVYTNDERCLLDACHRACRRAGVTVVGTHDLRRTFASYCYHLGIPEEITRKNGGWKDLETLRKIYTKISDADMAEAGETIEGFFNFGNENANDD